MSNVGGTYEVFVRAVPDIGARYRVSQSTGSCPVWSRTAPELFFQSESGQIKPVSRYATRSGAFIPEPPKPWGSRRLDGHDDDPPFCHLHPDGRRIVGVVWRRATAGGPNGRVTFLLNFKDELRRRVPLP